MKSMTGFGRGASRAAGLSVAVEAGSVNRKQLDVRVHVPRPLQTLEPRIAALARRTASRGQIALTVRVKDERALPGGAGLGDADSAAAWIAEIRGLAAKLNLPDDLSASSLLAIQDTLQRDEARLDPEAAWPPVERAARTALRGLAAMKETEGAALKKALRSQLRALRGPVEKIRTRAPKIVERYRKRLRQRLQGAGIDCAPMDPTLAREVAVFAERADIAEELARLESHFRQWETFSDSSKAQGRALDFLCQEMFREINTIGAKANDAVVARLVIHAKTALERMREQVQNVE